jgi:very-short-patch-repair endonuclease
MFCSLNCAALWRVKHPKKGPSGLERRMARFLDMLGVAYEAQRPFPGIGVVDFYLPEQHIAVEVDGGYWHTTERQRVKDVRKGARLRALDVEVIRVPGTDLGERPIKMQRELRLG